MDTQLLTNLFNKFLYLFSELAILFLGITFLVQFIQQKISPEKIQWLLGGKKGALGYIIAALLGSVTPFCTCSTIPLLKGLIRANAGFGATMTFLLTSPLLNPIIIGMFWVMLGAKITIIYFAFALVFAIIASILLEKLGFERFIIQTNINEPSSSSCCSKTNSVVVTSCCKSSNTSDQGDITINNSGNCCASVVTSKPNPILMAMQSSWKDFTSILPHLILSCIIGAIVYEQVPTEFLQKVVGKDNLFSIPIAAIIGIPLYVRTSVLIPLSSVLIEKGVSLGAMMALIIGGGGASLPEIILLKSIFKKELVIAFITIILLMAMGAGFTTLLLVG